MRVPLTTNGKQANNRLLVAHVNHHPKPCVGFPLQDSLLIPRCLIKHKTLEFPS